MSVELGVLLGQTGGAQSFENVGSWSLATLQCSLALQSTDVHSSGGGARLQVFSGAAGALRYDYLAPDDALARWCSDATTHRIVAQGWTRLDVAAWSGQVSVAIGSASLGLSAGAALAPFRLETVAASGDPLRLEFRPGAGLQGSGALYIDDVLVTADAVTLLPDWGLTQRRTLAATRNGTLGGREGVLVWGEHSRHAVPLHYVPSSVTDRLRGWWRAGVPLLFTLDTSNAEAQWPARIGGSTGPLGSPSRPYWNAWEGTLLLEGLCGGLDF
jgi:hypothetical protein